MYADEITESMQRTIDETVRRRTIQMQYNKAHNITPQQIVKSISTTLKSTKDSTVLNVPHKELHTASVVERPMVADPIIKRMSSDQLRKSIEYTKGLMKQSAEALDFIQAAQYVWKRFLIIRMGSQ